MFQLTAVGVIGQPRHATADRVRYCDAVLGGWLLWRGGWWIAVDSVVRCQPGDRVRIPEPESVPLEVRVDSGYLTFRGKHPRDTQLFISAVAPRVLPAGITAEGVMAGDTIVVRGAGGGSQVERVYIERRP
jgi:hypothetical protein